MFIFLDFLFVDNTTDLKENSEQYYHQPGDVWPDLETFKQMPFDYTIHDPKYEDASLICSTVQKTKNDGQNTSFLYLNNLFWYNFYRIKNCRRNCCSEPYFTFQSWEEIWVYTNTVICILD